MAVPLASKICSAVGSLLTKKQYHSPRCENTSNKITVRSSGGGLVGSD